MNNEIKEILDKLNNINNYDYSETCDNKNNVIEKEYDIYLSKKETDLLLDYITNLQQENERLKEENKYLDELRNANYSSRQDSLSRIEKAIEYIENNEVCCLEYIGRNGITGNLEKQIQRDLVNRTDLLNILNGRSDE